MNRKLSKYLDKITREQKTIYLRKIVNHLDQTGGAINTSNIDSYPQQVKRNIR